MQIRYVKNIDVLNIDLGEGKFDYSEELAEGIILDISKEGEILSIEVVDASKRLRKEIMEKLAKKYLARV
ncbi:DUF2283 domain-containing protein [Candidatus Aerophobetes bacterium]|nr:DUF2283 domain-containing protein [Candidatus Aerophobetes bacterium]